jgi:tetratricopeptide (TPR) repeat protein
VGSFLPVNLCLSFYVTNDPLTGLWITLAFYFFLRLIEHPEANARLALALGLTLGAALLSKLSALPAIPVFFLGLILHQLRQKNFLFRDWWRNSSVAAGACVLVCGWYFICNRLKNGGWDLPKSDFNAMSDTSWWQDPGFRTTDYYWHFGQSLVAPLFSGLHSFADGIYSTFWGDGLISGEAKLLYRPPWNYDLMHAGYWLALGLTVLAIAGLLAYRRKIFQTTDPLGVLVAGIIFAYAGALLLLTLRAPWLAEVKALYAFPALLPFAALTTAGWIWLARKIPALQVALWLLLLVWVFTVYNSLWIRTSNFEYWRSCAIVQLQKQNFSGAAEDLGHALRLNSNDAESHVVLAETFFYQGKTAEALREYIAALNLEPDAPDLLGEIAQILAHNAKDDAEHAIKIAGRACELTNYRQANLVSILAVAYANAGQWEAAASRAQIACDLATNDGQPGWLKPNLDLLKLCQSHPPEKN